MNRKAGPRTLNSETESTGSLGGMVLGRNTQRRVDRFGAWRGSWMLYTGEWFYEINYFEQDIVEDNGSFFIAIQRSGPEYGGEKATTDTEYWLPFGGGGGASLERYEVSGLANAEADVNYITAYKLNSDGTHVQQGDPPQDRLYYIALPRSIQRSVWRNKTVDGWKLMTPPTGIDMQERRKVAISVTGVPANTVVREVLDPRYNAGDIIYAFSCITGVAPVGIGTLTLMDANIDARKWVYPSYSVKACVNGVTQDIVMPIGLNFWSPLTIEDP